MKVVMLKDVGGVGRKDTIVEVADGFALNSLIPQGKAAQATPDRIAQLNKKMQLDAKATQERNAKMHAALKEIDGRSIVLKAKSNEHGHLFKAIKKEDVAQAISQLAGCSITAEMLHQIEATIKATGGHAVRVAAHGAEATVQLVVEPQ